MGTELELAHYLVEIMEAKIGKTFGINEAKELVNDFESAIDDYVCSMSVELHDDPLFLNGKIASYQAALSGIIALSKDREVLKKKVKAAIIENNLDTDSSLPIEYINGGKEGNEEIFKIIISL